FNEADHNVELFQWYPNFDENTDIKNKDERDIVTKIEVDKKEKRVDKVLLANIKEDENSPELDEIATLRSTLIKIVEQIILNTTYDDRNRLVYDQGKLVELYNEDIVEKHGELRKYFPEVKDIVEVLAPKYARLKNNERTDTLLDVNVKPSKNKLDEKCKKWFEKVQKFSYKVRDIEIKRQALRSTYYDGCSMSKRVLVNRVVIAKDIRTMKKKMYGEEFEGREIEIKKHYTPIVKAKNDNNGNKASDSRAENKIKRDKRDIMDVKIKVDKLENNEKKSKVMGAKNDDVDNGVMMCIENDHKK
ncbi:899_t:CDS:2, partial [Gigaspora margarita]